MAAMTLGAKKEDGPRLSAHDDDLPVFSASAFSAPTAGVLLPTVAPERNNKMVYIFMGVIGFLAVAAIVLVIFIVLGKNKAPSSTTAGTTGQVASVDPGKAPPVQGKPTVSSTAPATSTPASSPSVAPMSAPAASTAGSQAVAPPTAPAQSKPEAAPTSRPERKPPVAVATTSRPERKPPEVKPVESQAAVARPPTQTCDEVACLVTPDLPCCGKKKPTQQPVNPNLPDKIGQQEIIQGMQSVVPRVMGCNSKAPGAGQFKVRITVGADGGVSAASAGAPVAGTPAAGCVESAVRGAHFKQAKSGITFNYPFTFH